MLIAHALVLALAASSWLDAPTPANWNVVGASVPHAPYADTSMNARCLKAGLTRTPASAADRALASAGWLLFNKPIVEGSNVILDAQVGFDGMCRPALYQAFVFSNGRFAGTLAPKAMQSRALGSLQTPKFVGSGTIVATYDHYADVDPLCCPSKLTGVTFRLATTQRGPLVAPLTARTYASQSGAPRAQSAPTVRVDGSIALASLVSLAEGHLRSVADSLETLAATSAAQSADWNAIAGPLRAAAKVNVAGVYFFAKTDGTYWTTAAGLQPVTLADRAYFKAALAGHATMGELLRSKSTGKAVATIAVPVFGPSGKVVGVLGGSVFLEALSTQLVREMQLGPDIAFFAVDSHVAIALDSDPGNIFVEPSKVSPELDAVGRKMLANDSGVQTYVYRGKARTMLFARSTLTGWRFGFSVVR